jgi:DNA-binding NarL/FixJ family response regulator
MRGKIRIGLVEDHEMVRQGLTALINDEPSLKVVFDVANGAELLEIVKIKKADVVLLDIEMPLVDGKTALKKLSSHFPDLSVVMLTAHTSIDDVVDCIALGAKGFLPKHCDFDKIVDAVYSVYEKGFYFDDFVTKSLVKEIVANRDKLADQFRQPLKPQEIEIIKLICEGCTNKEIGQRLFLSTRTIEGYRLKIAEKTTTSNIVELVLYAIRNGIISKPI